MMNHSPNFKSPSFDHRICIAPMLHYTDRHFRFFMRMISRHVVLYTELAFTKTVLHSPYRFTTPTEVEHPVAFQLGGSDREELEASARAIEQWGYDEINLNVGCPSKRVEKGGFGACLLRTPEVVVVAVDAIKQVTNIPVSVKTRLGLQETEQEFGFEEWSRWVEKLFHAGCSTIIVHARMAHLKNLSPKQNRSLLPLQYEAVYQLKREHPEFNVVINGGIKTCDEIASHLTHVDGVMIGREAIRHPYFLVEADRRFFNDPHPILTRAEILERYQKYMAEEKQKKKKLSDSVLKKPIAGLYHGQPNAHNMMARDRYE